MNNEKVNILNLTQEELTEFLVSLGLKKFYGKEVFIWLHKKIIRNFDDMTNLSLKDREILKENAYIPFFNLLKHQVSKLDRTEKFLFELEDKGTIETVLLRHRDSKNKEIRKAHENPMIKKIYKDYLGRPYGERAHNLLHTKYQAREKI